MTNFSQTIDINPLLKDFPVDIGRGDWWKRLTHDPFRGEDIETMSETRRDLLLDTFDDIYVPTALTAEIAYQIHRMLVGGWIRRNPHDPLARQSIYQLAHCANYGLLNVPCFSTATRGMLLKGITKQGKSRLIKRVLRQYPQVIRRGEDRESGWLELDQLVYLVIPMPTDASKGGFLMQAFIELDKVLGTNYAQELKIKDSSINVQLVQLLSKLAVHRCGLLVVEEAQESNELSKERFGRDFNTFFLRVLNTGIPTILVGNPKAFAELETNSQLMSRLTDPGQYELQPSIGPGAAEWCNDLVPGLWGKNILPEPDEPIADLNDFLWKATGGFVHYLGMLRRETLRAAIQDRARGVESKHINAALQTPIMLEGRKIATSYWSGVKDGEVRYVDIPGTPDPTVISARRRRGQRRA